MGAPHTAVPEAQGHSRVPRPLQEVQQQVTAGAEQEWGNPRIGDAPTAAATAASVIRSAVTPTAASAGAAAAATVTAVRAASAQGSNK